MTAGFRLTAVQRLAGALAVTLVGVLIALYLLMSQPWLGLTLVADGDEGLRIAAVDTRGPSASVPVGARLLAVEASGARIELAASDLVEEPDSLDSYATFNLFMERQDAIAGLLRGEAVTLSIATSGAADTVTVTPEQARPLGSLPAMFWFQIGCAVTIMAIASWVWSLRPGDSQVARFALAGAGAALSILMASVYSSRELAIHEGVFRTLSFLNHLGAIQFAIFMIGLFVIFPKPLGLGWLYRLSALYLVGFLILNAFAVMPNISSGFYLGIVMAMVTIIVLIGLQYRATRDDVASRRALLWLGVSVIVGAGAFSALMAIPILAGETPVISQAQSFGFFPVIYLGVALGLTRYRLFDLDRWAFDVLTYALAVVLFIALDFALVVSLALSFSVSVGVTALIVGLLYLPARNYLSSRLFGRRERDDYRLFRAAADIALQPTLAERDRRWRETLEASFQPLTMESDPAFDAESPAIARDGLVLRVPAYPWAAAVRLEHPSRGRSLFGEPHLRTIGRLAVLVSEAEQSRDAYDRGVREERRRIGRDLHDNVGATLMSSLHAREPDRSRTLIRDALSDIREIVAGLSDRHEPLSNVIAGLRAETAERAGSVDVEWPPSDVDECAIPLPYAVYRSLTSAHREMISNVLRHGGATSIRIDTRLDGGRLVHRVENDLGNAGTFGPGGGNGLVNLDSRARELGGSFRFQREERLAIAQIELPMVVDAE